MVDGFFDMVRTPKPYHMHLRISNVDGGPVTIHVPPELVKDSIPVDVYGLGKQVEYLSEMLTDHRFEEVLTERDMDHLEPVMAMLDQILDSMLQNDQATVYRQRSE
jgi:hypothetical protein